MYNTVHISQRHPGYTPARYLLFFLLFLHCWRPSIAQNIVFSAVEGRQELNEEQIRNVTQVPDGRLVVITEGMLNLFDGAGFKTIHIDDESTISLSRYKGYHHSYIENNRFWFKNAGKLAIINLLNEQCYANPQELLRNLGISEPPADLFVDAQQNIWVLTASDKLICYDQAKKHSFIFLDHVTASGSNSNELHDVVGSHNRLYLFYKSGWMRCFDRQSRKELYEENFGASHGRLYNSTLYVVPDGNYLYLLRNTMAREGQLMRFDIESRQTKVVLETPYWLNTLAIDKKGAIWVCGKDGLWLFSPEADHSVFFPELSLTGGVKIKNEVSTLFCDEQNGIWLGTLNKGLFYYHPERFKFTSFDRSHFRPLHNDGFQINCFEEKGNGAFYIGTTAGLYSARLQDGQLAAFRPLLPNNICHSLLKDKTGRLWVGAGNGLFCVEGNGETKQYLKTATTCVYAAGEGRLLIGTKGDGLLQYDVDAGKFTTLVPDSILPGVKQLIPWERTMLGISSAGLFVLNLQNGSVEFPAAANVKKPMFRHTNHQYTSLIADRDSLLWLGTYDGLNMWDAKRQRLYQLHTTDGLVNNSIKAMAEDRDGSIWVTTSRGVSHIQKIREGQAYRFRIVNYNSYNGVIERTFSERAAFISSGSVLFLGGVDGMNILTKTRTANNIIPLKPVLLDLKLFGKAVPLPHSLAGTDSLVLNHDQNFFSITYSGLNYINPSQTYYRYMLEEVDKEWRTEKRHSGIGEANYTNLPNGNYTFRVMASADGVHWTGPVKTLVVIINPPFWRTTYAKIFYGLIVLVTAWAVFRYVKARNKRSWEKKQAEAIEKAKSDFLTNISHELRTPLTLIMTPLRSLIPKVHDPAIRLELLQINNHSELLLDTVNQLLEFRRMEAGGEMLHLSYANDLSFIQEVCNAYQPLEAEKNIQYAMKIYPGEMEIWVDKQKVVRIITNLLSNAFKFTDAGGSVTIDVQPDEMPGFLLIRVQDSGIGISSTELTKIFDRFYQAGNQPVSGQGTGIGLFMVKQYAVLHGGSVHVSSVEGQGTCFEIKLQVRGNRSLQNGNGADAQKKTLLIVEDNATFRAFLEKELKDTYTIITAENGKEGIEKAISNAPDIVITDMMMPEMTGTEFCSALRNELSISHTPVIVLTARSSTQAELEGYESGADAYLVKPFHMELLRLRISRLLQLSESRKQVFRESKEVKAEWMTSNPLDRDFLERAFKCVQENLSNPEYTVEKFSAQMLMDRTGLYRKMVALTGHTPSNFIRGLRLKKAAELLSEKQLPISDIAMEVGFNSLSYFTKCFHEEYGIVPSKYTGNEV